MVQVIEEGSVRGPYSGSLPILGSRNVWGDLYPQALVASYYGHRVVEPSYADSREPDLYEKVRRDPVVAAAIDQRVHAIAARRWSVTPDGQDEADLKAASLIEEILKGIENFPSTRYELAQAVITSRAYGYVYSVREPATFGGVAGDWWRPTRVKDIDRRRVRWVPVWENQGGASATLRTRLELFSVAGGAWRPISDPRSFMQHTYNDEEARLGYGRGLLESIYFYHWAKGVVLREGLQGLERWAQGLVAIQIDSLRDASTGKPNTAIVQEWLDVIEKMRARHGLVFDKADQITIPPGNRTGHQMVIEFLKYLDEAITRVILGGIRQVGMGEGGGYARAETEGDSQEQLVQFDRLLLDESLTRHLIRPIWFYNRPLFVDAGLGDAKCPRFSSIQEPRENPSEAVDVASKALAAGIDLQAEEVYDRIGFTQPTDGDRIIKGQLPPVAESTQSMFPGIELPPELAAMVPGEPAAEEPASGEVQTPQDVDVTEEAVLNGAQVQAALDIVLKVQSRDLPRDSGLGALEVLYNLTPEQALQIMGQAGEMELKEEPAPVKMPAEPKDEPAEV